MSDNASSPADKAQLDKITDVLAALVDETRQSKVMISDVIAQRTQYAADIKDLKASIDTTRRTLDPEQLGAHVADNIDQFMGPVAQNFAKGIQLNHDASRANQNAAQQTITAAKDIASETNFLSGLAKRLEERDKRSKWDWAILGCAMLVAAALAGAAGYFFAADQIRTNDFDRSIRLITQDDDAYWCGQADGQIINSQSDAKFCAIHMPNYQEPMEPAE